MVCFLTEDVSKLKWYSHYVTCVPSIDLVVYVIAEGLNVRTTDVLKGRMEVDRKQWWTQTTDREEGSLAEVIAV